MSLAHSWGIVFSAPDAAIRLFDGLRRRAPFNLELLS
jgi:hypothetical protein